MATIRNEYEDKQREEELQGYLDDFDEASLEALSFQHLGATPDEQAT